MAGVEKNIEEIAFICKSEDARNDLMVDLNTSIPGTSLTHS
jgi:hypothetical protein